MTRQDKDSYRVCIAACERLSKACCATLDPRLRYAVIVVGDDGDGVALDGTIGPEELEVLCEGILENLSKVEVYERESSS